MGGGDGEGGEGERSGGGSGDWGPPLSTPTIITGFSRGRSLNV